MPNIIFDVKCYEYLYDRFHRIFEDELINDICNVGMLRKIPEYTELMSIGDNVTHIPLVVTGSLKVMTEDEDGKELFLYYLELGDTCAMTLRCCTGASKSNVTAITEENTEILYIPVKYMDIWMVKYNSWRNFILESYNNRMTEMLAAIYSLAFSNMEERLSKYLKERVLVTQSNEIKMTHLQIANDLHSSRVVISRLMKKLEQQGYIKQYRNRIELLDS